MGELGPDRVGLRLMRKGGDQEAGQKRAGDSATLVLRSSTDFMARAVAGIL
jgi:hypothetical protein